VSVFAAHVICFIQAAWAFIVSLPVTLAIANPVSVPIGAGSALAFTAFAGGLSFEAVAGITYTLYSMLLIFIVSSFICHVL
jgi:steroid 5-alpha reductase family enzyme